MRKAGQNHASHDRSTPSMGPQHESCGKRALSSGPGPRAAALQWGRNMRVAESALVPARTTCRRCLQWGRNMRVAESMAAATSILAGIRPSMGPQHESCGKSAWNWRRARPPYLQWGRNMRVAESGALGTAVYRTVGLQWGRNMRVAESLRRPSACSRWRNLQWGRNMRVAESRSTAWRGRGQSTPSMGPQHESCGKLAPVERSAGVGALQWGRNMRVAERCTTSRATLPACSFNGAAT